MNRSYLNELTSKVREDMDSEDYEIAVKMAKLRQRYGRPMEGDDELLKPKYNNKQSTCMKTINESASITEWERHTMGQLTVILQHDPARYERMHSDFLAAQNLKDDGRMIPAIGTVSAPLKKDEKTTEWERLSPSELAQMQREDPARYDRISAEYFAVMKTRGKK